MKKPRFIYLLSAATTTAAPLVYASLEALTLDPASGFRATSAAIQAARKVAGGWPVLVKGYTINKLTITEMTTIRATLTA